MDAQQPSPSDDGAADPRPLPEADKNNLKTRLNLSTAQEEELSKLSSKLQDEWFELVREWFEPSERLAEIDAEVGRREGGIAAIYVPSAEGVATYRGLFGGNNRFLDPKDKDLICKMLQRQIGYKPENGNGSNGNGSSSSSHDDAGHQDEHDA